MSIKSEYRELYRLVRMAQKSSWDYESTLRRSFAQARINELTITDADVIRRQYFDRIDYERAISKRRAGWSRKTKSQFRANKFLAFVVQAIKDKESGEKLTKAIVVNVNPVAEEMASMRLLILELQKRIEELEEEKEEREREREQAFNNALWRIS